MKKSTLFMACCIGLMLFASCKKDPVAPTIAIASGEGYATENASYYSSDPITVGFVATGENLTQLEVTLTQNGTTLSSHSESIEKQANYSYSHAFTIDASGIVTITGTVTDAAGQTASKSFNITCNEKPNAKFLGRYEGNALATGTMVTNIQGIDPMDFTDRPVPVILNLESGEKINEVVGTCKVEDRTVECKGTVEGNVVTFSAINDVVTFTHPDYPMLPIPLNVTYTIKGTLNGEQLALEGDFVGNSQIPMGGEGTATIDMNGTVGGSLEKIQ